MLDIHSLLKNLRRPKLLVQAARFGVDDYRRNIDLQRLLNCPGMPGPSEAIVRLLDIESELNDARVNHDAGYSLAQHIDALTAIMSEQRLLAQPQPEVT